MILWYKLHIDLNKLLKLSSGRAEADENIENLADLTDGKSYYVRDDDSSEGFNEAFYHALTYQSSVSANEMMIVKVLQETLRQWQQLNSSIAIIHS